VRVTDAVPHRSLDATASRSLILRPVLRLITIPISHYCEKARWALDRAGIAYREERHIQGIHRLAAKRAGGGTTVPVLVTPDGVLGESEDILAWVDRRTPPEHRLFPAELGARDEVERLCRRFDDELGPKGRRLMYIHMLPQRKLMLRFNNEGVPSWEDRAIRYGWPLVVRFARRELGIRPGIETEDEAAVWRELDFVAELLADGRPHLCGDRFGAADLTFAALSAAVVVPPVYGVPLPQPDVMPPHIRAMVERVREHPAGHYALSLILERRRESVV
jgi:glutathione S-transferase